MKGRVNPRSIIALSLPTPVPPKPVDPWSPWAFCDPDKFETLLNLMPLLLRDKAFASQRVGEGHHTSHKTAMVPCPGATLSDQTGYCAAIIKQVIDDTGILQCDGWPAYEAYEGDHPEILFMSCFAHI